MRVLVAYDGGEAGDRALEAIANWAKASQAEVHLATILKPGEARDTSRGNVVHAMTPAATPAGQLLHTGEPLPKLAETRSEAISGILQETRESLRDTASRYLAGVEVTVHADINEHVAEAIIALAGQLGAELVAVGTHGRTGISHALMGSVAEKVVRQSPLPVLVIGPKVGAGE